MTSSKHYVTKMELRGKYTIKLCYFQYKQKLRKCISKNSLLSIIEDNDELSLSMFSRFRLLSQKQFKMNL